MSKRHTPGPWKTAWTLPWGYRRSQDGMSIIGSQPSVISPEGTVLLPHVFTRTDDEITANLTLAAAAPDLLEAAREARQELRAVAHLIEQGIEVVSLQSVHETITALHAAIAKAEGV